MITYAIVRQPVTFAKATGLGAWIFIVGNGLRGITVKVSCEAICVHVLHRGGLFVLQRMS